MSVCIYTYTVCREDSSTYTNKVRKFLSGRFFILVPYISQTRNKNLEKLNHLLKVKGLHDFKGLTWSLSKQKMSGIFWNQETPYLKYV